MSENVTNMDVAAQNAGTEEVAGTAIAKASEGAVAVPQAMGTAYITQLLNNTFEDFQKANDGLDLDFVYMGSWLVVDKKGAFVDKDDESVKYSDHIDVIIGKGEKRWSLWGLQNSPEDGQLIVACSSWKHGYRKTRKLRNATAWTIWNYVTWLPWYRWTHWQKQTVSRRSILCPSRLLLLLLTENML